MLSYHQHQGLLIAGGDFGLAIYGGGGRELLSLETTSPVYGVALHPNGELLAVGLRNGDLALMSSSTREVLWNTNLNGRIHTVSWSPDGEQLAVGGDFGVVVYGVSVVYGGVAVTKTVTETVAVGDPYTSGLVGLLGVAGVAALFVISQVPPKPYIEGVEGEYVEGIGGRITVKIGNRGLTKWRGEVRITIKGKTIYTGTIEVPGKTTTKIQVQIPGDIA